MLKSGVTIEKIAHIVIIFIALAAPAITMLNKIAVQNERLIVSEQPLRSFSGKYAMLKEQLARHEQEIAVLKQISYDKNGDAMQYSIVNQKINDSVLSIWKRLSADTSQIQSNRADIEVLKRTHKN